MYSEFTAAGNDLTLSSNNAGTHAVGNYYVFSEHNNAPLDPAVVTSGVAVGGTAGFPTPNGWAGFGFDLYGPGSDRNPFSGSGTGSVHVNDFSGQTELHIALGATGVSEVAVFFTYGSVPTDCAPMIRVPVSSAVTEKVINLSTASLADYSFRSYCAEAASPPSLATALAGLKTISVQTSTAVGAPSNTAITISIGKASFFK
ncbi:hypothetical protein [Niveibacterium sp. SC-1]|uniref:hypothetical protein n=1 Tax=Niveibacterium sp. SC-1 TaxID=3135646 RepID=UPI00311E0C60